MKKSGIFSPPAVQRLLRFAPAAVLIVGCTCITLRIRAGESLYVYFEKAIVKKAPTFFSPNAGTIFYGERATKLAESMGWIHMRTRSGLEGWVHESVFTEKNIKLRANQPFQSSGASRDEIALAGKGFNEQVEREYKKKHPTLNYHLIQEIENKHTVTDGQIIDFVREGKLNAQ